MKDSNKLHSYEDLRRGSLVSWPNCLLHLVDMVKYIVSLTSSLYGLQASRQLRLVTLKPGVVILQREHSLTPHGFDFSSGLSSP